MHKEKNRKKNIKKTGQFWLMTAKELATNLRVSDSTLRRLTQNGAIPKPMKIGGQNRWNYFEVKEFLTRQRKKR